MQKHEESIKKLIENAKYIVENEDLRKKQPTQDYNDKKLFGLF